MQIRNLRVNHLENPLGFETDLLTFSWVAESDGGKKAGARVEIASGPDFSEILYDSGMQAGIDGVAFHPEIALSPRTRYYWRVTETAVNGDTGSSETAWFETGKRDEPWAARVLGEEADAGRYERLAGEIKAAIRKEYFTETGRCAIDTQTARVVALYFGLLPPEMEGRQMEDLTNLLRLKLSFQEMRAGMKEPYPPRVSLTTGFVGTPYLCPALADHGDLMDAYSLLLKTDYPSWLYEVKMGATTVWERWNSINPDGHISSTGMNSLNHYAYGSIVEWMYRYMCGLNQTAPGFKKVRFQPMPDPENRLASARMEYDSAAGKYACGWEKAGNGYTYTLTVPFDCEAEVVLPSGRTETVGAGSYTFTE